MHSDKPLVTVVTTVHNRETYLPAAVESVLASRFGHFELLILDDASTDASVEIARRFARHDRRVRFVVNERNLGDYANRNRALELVTTPYLKYHDSDDLMYPHCLDVMVTLMEDEPTAGFALTAGRAWPGGACPMLITPRMAYQREFLGLGMFFCGPSGALFRTDVLREIGGFPDFGAASDYCFWLRACTSTNCLLIPGDLFWYRLHPGQELEKPGARRDYARAHAEAWRALSSATCPLDAEEIVLARRGYVKRLLRLSWRDFRAGRFRLLVYRLKTAGFRLRDLVRYPPMILSSPNAGTPLDSRGQFIVPAWLRKGVGERQGE